MHVVGLFTGFSFFFSVPFVLFRHGYGPLYPPLCCCLLCRTHMVLAVEVNRVKSGAYEERMCVVFFPECGFCMTIRCRSTYEAQPLLALSLNVSVPA